ncbi:hypothetical protein HZB03_04600 [Candidatus Woesearchaeota archaeon]|nr:hypothetical protein [Candidatus Woesearchaeota archaeon]
MVDSGDKIQFIPLIVGLIAIIFLGYIVKILIVPPEYQVYLYIFSGLIVIGIGIMIYFCIKNLEFREKTLSVIKKLLAGISKIGLDVLKNMKKGERKGKKTRVPTSPALKNKVYYVAGGKCQECGKKGNLKIHHIDENPSNNNITNLVLLCGNHHDDADKGVIPKWRLKNIRDKQATPDHTSYAK